MTEARAGEARKAGSVEFEGVTPILRVGGLAASIDYYVKVLGFKVDWQEPGIAGWVSGTPPHHAGYGEVGAEEIRLTLSVSTEQTR